MIINAAGRDLLGTFEVTVNDLMIMQIFDSRSNLFGPFYKSHRRNFVLSISQKIKKGSIWTIFHDNTEYRGLGTNSSKLYDIMMIEFFQMMYVCIG